MYQHLLDDHNNTYYTSLYNIYDFDDKNIWFEFVPIVNWP